MTVYLGLARKQIIWNKKFNPDHGDRDVQCHLQAQNCSACECPFVVVVVCLSVCVKPSKPFSTSFRPS